MGQRPKNSQPPKTSSLRPSDRMAEGRELRTVSRCAVFAVCGFLLLAVALVFGQTVRHGFVNFDDKGYVYENPDLARGLTVDGIAWAFTTTKACNWHPLTWLSYFIDYRVCGLKPWGYHLSNVLLHAVNAILLLLVLWRITGEFWPSAFVAAVFAIHPLRAESVAWVSERKDLLSGLFFMLTLGAYASYVRRPFSWLRYLAVVALFALGLMAKPMLVTLPLVLLILDYWPLGRMKLGWRVLVEKLPLLALSAASCVATSIAQREAIAPLDFIPFSARLANAFISYVAYVSHLFYPVGLAVLYPHQGSRLPDWQVIVALLLLVCISVGVAAWRRKCPYLLVGWCWYLGMLVPVIGLVQVGLQSMADRYTYLPQIGLVIGVAWGTKQVLRSWRYRNWLLAITSVLVVAALMGCAWQQASYWCDGESLWRHAIASTLPNAVAQNNLGGILARSGRPDEAIVHYRKALEIKPDYAEAYNNYGVILGQDGRLDEAIAHLKKALELKPDYPDARDNLDVIQSQREELVKGLADRRKLLRSRPDDVALLSSIAWVLATVPNDSIRDGAKAVEFAQRAEKLTDGREPAILDTLAAAQAETGRFAEAVQTARKALELADRQDKRPLAESIEAKIRLYEAGKPFRETKRPASTGSAQP